MNNDIYTYTSDMTRPNCPTCGVPVEQYTQTPEEPWKGTCCRGHSAIFQLDIESESQEEFNKEKDYVVKWVCDSSAATPEQAALQMYEKYFREDHYATVFEVTDEQGNTVTVDLDLEFELKDAH